MPRRRAEPDREAIEAALWPELRRALDLQLAASAIPEDRRDWWHLVPALLQAWAATALGCLRHDYAEAGESADAALAEASARFRIPAETLRSWERRHVERVMRRPYVQNEPCAVGGRGAHSGRR